MLRSVSQSPPFGRTSLRTRFARMPPSQNQVLVFLIAGFGLLGLHLILNGCNSKKHRRERYVDSIDGYIQDSYDGSGLVHEGWPDEDSAYRLEKGLVEGYSPRRENFRSMPFLTGSYSNLEGASRLDVCIDQCLGWLDLPPFDRKAGYCIKGCVRQFRSPRRR